MSTKDFNEEILASLEQTTGNSQLIAQHLGQISQSLMKLNILLESLVDSGSIGGSQSDLSLSIDQNTEIPEVEFLNEIVSMYQKEAQRKALQQKKRKSSKYIQSQIQEISCDFFSKHLGSNFEVKKYRDAFILISKKNADTEKNIALIRVVNDLGFMRHKLKEYALEPLINFADELNIPKDNTFLIVLTLVNSLVQADVREVLGRYDLSNKELYSLTNSGAIEIIKSYLTAKKGLLGEDENKLYDDKNASNHVKFILRSSNPNAEGDAMFVDPRYQPDWSKNMWYEKPFLELFEKIRQM